MQMAACGSYRPPCAASGPCQASYEVACHQAFQACLMHLLVGDEDNSMFKTATAAARYLQSGEVLLHLQSQGSRSRVSRFFFVGKQTLKPRKSTLIELSRRAPSGDADEAFLLDIVGDNETLTILNSLDLCAWIAEQTEPQRTIWTLTLLEHSPLAASANTVTARGALEVDLLAGRSDHFGADPLEAVPEEVGGEDSAELAEDADVAGLQNHLEELFAELRCPEAPAGKQKGAGRPRLRRPREDVPAPASVATAPLRANFPTVSQQGSIRHLFLARLATNPRWMYQS